MLSKVLVGDWPLTQGYGATAYAAEPPGHGFRRWHEGVDLGCPVGTVCLAARDATATRFGPGYLVLEDADAVQHFYFHISGSLLDIDQFAAAGSPVATSGAEAVAGGVAPSGPHLHYGVRRNPYRYQVDDFDPAPYWQPTFGPDPGGDTVALTKEDCAAVILTAIHGTGQGLLLTQGDVDAWVAEYISGTRTLDHIIAGIVSRPAALAWKAAVGALIAAGPAKPGPPGPTGPPGPPGPPGTAAVLAPGTKLTVS